ncbi:DUF6770 family protein [Pontibacter populi]|uniref:DUF6770 family protein n=1 Tax=Pontibacter populi TaxID=890055 RepID=A0ABV1RXW3_9BACT
MKKSLHLLLTCFFVLSTLASYGQTQTLTGFKSFSKKALTPIYDGSEVKGYTMFYRADKADKKNDNFGLDFYDQNLQKVKTVLIPKERHFTHLIRSAYNGEAFSFYFYNAKSRSLELDVFDKSLTKIASKRFEDISKADMQMAGQEIQMPGNGENKAMGGLNIYAVPGKGFIKNGFTGMMKGYSLEMLDNKLNLLWTSKSDEKSKEYESVLINEVTNNYVLATLARRPNMMSKKFSFSMIAIDIKTGKTLFDIAIENDSKEQLSLSSFTFDEVNKEFVAMGEYYALDDKPLINKSQGFYVKRVGTDGKEKGKQFYSWSKDINPLLPAAAKKSIEEGFVNFVHKIIRSADGKQHIVAEQYKVKADGVGIALAVMGGGTSTAKGVIGNMMIYSLNADHKIDKVSFFEKDQTDWPLIPGSGFYGAGLIGHVINMTGGFDYQFTQLEKDQISFNTAYLNYRDVKNSKVDEKTLVNIIYSGEAAPVTDKMKMTLAKGIRSYVYPAKPGYVLVLNNEVEASKLEMKLVKLNK